MFYAISTNLPSRSPQCTNETINTGDLPPVPVLLERIAQIVDDFDADDLLGIWTDTMNRVREDIERASEFDERGEWWYPTPDGGHITARVNHQDERNAYDEETAGL